MLFLERIKQFKMKKYFYVFALVAFALASCEKNEIEKTFNSNDVKFAGLRVNLPSNYNESVLSLSLSDLQNLFYTNSSGGIMRAKSSEFAGVTLEELNQITQMILTKYPRLDSLTLDEIEKIRVNFPDLSLDNIVENINVIDSFYTSLVRYDLMLELTEVELSFNTKALKVSSSGDYKKLNSEEFWYLFWRPSLIDPISEAKERAVELTNDLIESEEEFHGMNASQDKADGFRHAMWNVLICKYVGESKSKISDCTEIADEFTTKHETGATQSIGLTNEQWELDKCMDLHNNAQGRKYFESVATVIKVGLFKVNRVSAPSEDIIVEAITENAKFANKINIPSDADEYPNNLVYIKD